MILVISFDVDADNYELNNKQKQLLRDFENASDKPLSGAEWFTTSEESYNTIKEDK